MQNGELVFTILSQLENLESYVSDMRYYVQNGIDSAIQKAINSTSSGNQSDFTSMMDLLDYSPFISDMNSFRTLPVTQLQKSSVYSYMLYRFWRSQSTQYKKVQFPKPKYANG